jgi:hypothetical protein
VRRETGSYGVTVTREALRVEGEHVCLLPALESPPESVEVNAANVLATRQGACSPSARAERRGRPSGKGISAACTCFM